MSYESELDIPFRFGGKEVAAIAKGYANILFVIISRVYLLVLLILVPILIQQYMYQLVRGVARGSVFVPGKDVGGSCYLNGSGDPYSGWE